MTISYVSGADTTLRDADINTDYMLYVIFNANPKLKLSDRVNSRGRGGVKKYAKRNNVPIRPPLGYFHNPNSNSNQEIS